MVCLTMRLLQLFYISRRPMNLLGHQCLRVIDTSYRSPFLFLEYVHYQNCHLSLSKLLGGRCSYLHQHTTLVNVLHFELHDRIMGHAHSVSFFSLEKGLVPIVSPLPLMDLSCSSYQHSSLQWHSQ
jgi:hypothetical protein